jgi:hypothetical protein
MRLNRPVFLLLLVLVAVATAAACGGGGSNKSTPTASVSGPPATDEQYLKAICTGTQDFSDALVSKTTADGIAQVIKQFSANLKKINPPADLRTFHAAFIKYLDDSLTDPTSLLTKAPPEPPDSVRQRLASKESSVPECKSPQFFNPAASPTAAASPTK